MHFLKAQWELIESEFIVTKKKNKTNQVNLSRKRYFHKEYYIYFKVSKLGGLNVNHGHGRISDRIR